jgi:Ca2+-binding RTX toxin-like protein
MALNEDLPMAVITGDKFDNNLTGTAGDDTITGAAGRDTLTGGGGADRILGNAGDDILNGQDGDDVLKGARGADTLSGGTGSDVLHGGEGTDSLTGGAGADVFLFKAGDLDGSADNILDFANGVDQIDLGALDVTQVVASNLTGVAGQLSLVSNPGIGISILQFDQDGDGGADLTIVVIGMVDQNDLVL